MLKSSKIFLSVLIVEKGLYSNISNINKVQTSDTETFYGKDALVYGWGRTSHGGVQSWVLLEVSVDMEISGVPSC